MGERPAGGGLTRKRGREETAGQGEMDDGKVHSGVFEVDDIGNQLNGLKL
jgi:hypothetical protein